MRRLSFPFERRPLLKLSRREVFTILAALQYWREEMLPHGRAIMQPYLKYAGRARVAPLNESELSHLSDRFRAYLRSLTS